MFVFGLRRAPEFDFSAAGDHRVLSAPSSRLRVDFSDAFADVQNKNKYDDHI